LTSFNKPIVEKAASAWLKNNGWRISCGPDIAQDWLLAAHVNACDIICFRNCIGLKTSWRCREKYKEVCVRTMTKFIESEVEEAALNWLESLGGLSIMIRTSSHGEFYQEGKITARSFLNSSYFILICLNCKEIKCIMQQVTN